VIALSTDKAVNPVNLYGATKLCSDKLFVSGNIYAGGDQPTRLAVVRYGNVLGSRGSIIPLWRQQVESGAGAVTVTDARMTRFWVTLEQAVQFVIQCFSRMQGGEIFVPKIPSMRIPDLAEAIAPGVPQKVIGIREGEKLHECLIGQDDARHTYEFDDHYVIAPEVFEGVGHSAQSYFAQASQRKLEEGFSYSSDSNSLWLGVEELRDVLAQQASLQTEKEKV
jgi:UDP-N-acetylglucosamine 4,6-dehydratase